MQTLRKMNNSTNNDPSFNGNNINAPGEINTNNNIRNNLPNPSSYHHQQRQPQQLPQQLNQNPSQSYDFQVASRMFLNSSVNSSNLGHHQNQGATSENQSQFSFNREQLGDRAYNISSGRLNNGNSMPDSNNIPPFQNNALNNAAVGGGDLMSRGIPNVVTNQANQEMLARLRLFGSNNTSTTLQREKGFSPHLLPNINDRKPSSSAMGSSALTSSHPGYSDRNNNALSAIQSMYNKMGSLSSNNHGAASASSYGMINHHNGLGATSVAAALAAANASSFKGLPSNAAAGGRIEATMSSYPNNLTTDQFLPSHHQNRVPTATAKTPASMTGTLPPLPQLQSFSCPTNHLHSAAQPQQQQQQLNQLGSSFHITPTTNPSSSDSCLQNSLQHGVSNIGGVSNHTVAASSMGVPTSAAVLSSLLPSIPSTLLSQEDPGWEGQFDNIRRFHKQFGHCNVPARFKGNPKLG